MREGGRVWNFCTEAGGFSPDRRRRSASPGSRSAPIRSGTRQTPFWYAHGEMSIPRGGADQG